MKLGSIVGLIIAAALTVAGITLCIIGSVSAGSAGRELFTQVDDGGTHYTQEITDDVTKLTLNFEDADVVINGGAERSSVEFINFNPNKYALSVTANVITFSESANIDSLLDIGDITMSFKGLRYLLDVRNAQLDGLDRRIVINLSDSSRLKMIDIDGRQCSLAADGVTLAGDILLDADTASVNIDSCSVSSTLGITADTLTANIKACTVGTLRAVADSAELFSDGTECDSCDITLTDGRVDYISSVTLDGKRIAVSTQSGGLMVNLKPTDSPFTHEPVTDGEDESEDAAPVKSFKIAAESAVINLQFPTELSPTDTPDAE